MFTHFYSDPHFGHAKIIQLAERPFADLDAMHRELRERYNKVVGPNDRTLWTGDAFFTKASTMESVLSRLNGEKWLVRGNHDKHSDQQYLRAGFSIVTNELFFPLGRFLCHASHYPFAKDTRTGDHRYADRLPPRRDGLFLIHGHTHAKERSSPGAVHVGVDAWDYRPATSVEVATILDGFDRRRKSDPGPV